MKIKFEYNEYNENDLFVKKSRTIIYKKKYNKVNKEREGNNIAKKISIVLFIILLLTIFIFIILINKFGKGQSEFNIDELDDKNIENQIHNINSSMIFFNAIPRRENLIIGRRYINKCLNDNLTNKFEKVDNPIISVIIPVFNCEKSIKYAISSIQNQNITNIEIILINDYSTDQSLNIIQEIQKNDKRIVLINNEKNMGTLYTRSIGILIAKGKFIFALDNDDMFFQEDLFDETHKIAIKGGFDIVGFRAVYVSSYREEIDRMYEGFFNFKKNNLILYQPKLGMHPVKKNGMYAANDYTIWGKCIKTKIYQKAVNALGKERYSMFLSWGEDSSIVFVIFNIAQSYIFIAKYGILHIKNNSTATKTQPRDNKVLGEVFFLDTLFEFSKNNSDKNIAVSHLINIKYKFDLYHIQKNSTRLYLLSILEKMMNCSYISESKHRQVKHIYKKIINNE